MISSFVSTNLALYNDEPNNTLSPYNMFLVKEDIRPIKTLTSSANFFLLPIQFQGKSSQKGDCKYQVWQCNLQQSKSIKAVFEHQPNTSLR